MIDLWEGGLSDLDVINRPSVDGVFYKHLCHWLIRWVIHSLWKYLHFTFTRKPHELGSWNFKRRITFPKLSDSCVTCHMFKKNPAYGRHRISRLMRIVAPIFLFPLASKKELILPSGPIRWKSGQSGEASRWRVSYQRGLLCLVFVLVMKMQRKSCLRSGS